MNRNRLNPYTATPSAPNGHRTRVRFLTTPELLTFNATTPGAARSDLWPRNGSHNFGGSPHASAWVAGLVPVARRDTTGAGSQKESFGHVHARVMGEQAKGGNERALTIKLISTPIYTAAHHRYTSHTSVFRRYRSASCMLDPTRPVRQAGVCR
jgi:hypothetical protein